MALLNSPGLYMTVIWLYLTLLNSTLAIFNSAGLYMILQWLYLTILNFAGLYN